MRVLFSSTSGHGHVIPMLQLASAVRARGHDALWATSAGAAALVSTAGVETVDAGAHGAEEAALRAGVRDRSSSLAGRDRSAWVFPRMFGAALTPPMASDLIVIARDWRPDLLVHEQAELAAPLVAAVPDRPSITHAFGTSHITAVQALRPVTGSPPTAAGLQPLVYVTLGTVQNRPDLLREIVSGVSALPVAVLVAVGPGVDPASLGVQPAHVQVESWVEQAEVLGRCSAVVSHGGSGTFLGALAQGVPQLCLPQAADQFRNAEAGLRAGAALTLGPDEVSPSAVRAAVERLLAEPGLRAGADRVAAEIARMPSPDEVVQVLEARFA